MNKTVVLIIAFAALAALVGYSGRSKLVQGQEIIRQPLPPETADMIVHAKIPALGVDGNGTLADVRIRIREGAGGVYYDMGESPLLNPETQDSIIIAIRFAEKYSGIEGKNDFYVSFSNDSELIAGRSAGAAIAINTIAALRKESLRKGVLITGGMDDSGEIRRVGNIIDKAEAAKAAGYSELLVPAGEKSEYVQPETCKGVTQGKCVPGKELVDVAEKTGIRVTEVNNVSQAYGLMRSN